MYFIWYPNYLPCTRHLLRCWMVTNFTAQCWYLLIFMGTILRAENHGSSSAFTRQVKVKPTLRVWTVFKLVWWAEIVQLSTLIMIIFIIVLYNYNTIIHIIIIIVLSLQYYINNDNTIMIIFCVWRITSHCRAHTRLVSAAVPRCSISGEYRTFLCATLLCGTPACLVR